MRSDHYSDDIGKNNDDDDTFSHFFHSPSPDIIDDVDGNTNEDFDDNLYDDDYEENRFVFTFFHPGSQAGANTDPGTAHPNFSLPFPPSLLSYHYLPFLFYPPPSLPPMIATTRDSKV